MSSTASSTTARYRVPRKDEQLLLLPGLDNAERQIEENRQRLQKCTTPIWGRPLTAWREQSRTEFSSFLPIVTSLDSPLILTGHQSEWIHPGVFVKNIVAHTLAKRQGGQAAHITIDSDLVKSSAVAVPGRKHNRLERLRTSCPNWIVGRPAEATETIPPEGIAQFLAEIKEQLAEEVPREHLDQIAAVFAVHQGEPLSAALIAARQVLEQLLDLDLPDVPISQIAESKTFLQFVASLIKNAENFATAYNGALARYRELNQLRSDTHPMPDLQKEEGYIELPLWCWSEKIVRRRSLWLKPEGNKLSITDRIEWSAELGDAKTSDESLADQIQKVLPSGVKIRPRALVTTLYLRLFLSDWFVHGIGGAKYDEVTDEIIRRQFGIEPPKFQVATGTFWLPLAEVPQHAQEKIRRLQKELRQARFHPEVLLNQDEGKVEKLVQQKQELIAAQKAAHTSGLTRSERRARTPLNHNRYQELEKIREQLTELAETELLKLEHELEAAQASLEEQQVVEYREYPLFLYPEKTIRKISDFIQNRANEFA